jgi:MFS superfamily sulfate permease-like transporter
MPQIESSWATVVFSASCIVVLLLCKYGIGRALNLKLLANIGPLLVVIGGILIVKEGNIENCKVGHNCTGGLSQVGSFKCNGTGCLPKPEWPFSNFRDMHFQFDDITNMLGPSFVVALIGYMECMTIAKVRRMLASFMLAVYYTC